MIILGIKENCFKLYTSLQLVDFIIKIRVAILTLVNESTWPNDVQLRH